jgi:hypothetical protein
LDTVLNIAYSNEEAVDIIKAEEEERNNKNK